MSGLHTVSDYYKSRCKDNIFDLLCYVHKSSSFRKKLDNFFCCETGHCFHKKARFVKASCEIFDDVMKMTSCKACIRNENRDNYYNFE